MVCRLTVKGKMQLVSCSVDTVYDAVTDYPRAPEIFGNIAESVVAREVCTSDCNVHVAQLSHPDLLKLCTGWRS